MAQLKLLGGVSLTGPDGPVVGRAAQRHRLALLALLARSRDRTLPRERLMAFLWPEADPERARGLLNESVYVLRKALGEGALVTAGDSIRLEPAAITSDAERFEAAAATGDAEGAVALYGGPFLDGFSIPGAVEFERWSDGERERLARVYRGSLAMLAEGAEARGSPAEAARWWAALAAEDGLNPRVAVRLMRALDAAGDRPAALRHARIHAALVETELGATAGASVVALAEELRRGGDGGDGGDGGAMALGASAASAGVAPGEATAHQGEPPATAQQRQRAAPPPRRRWSHAPAAPALVAVLVVVVAAAALARTLWWRAAARPAGTTAAEERVAIFPFAVRGGSEAASYLADGLVTLLAIGLDGGGGLRVVDPHTTLTTWARDGAVAADAVRAAALADQLRARYFVLGDVVQAGGRLRLSAALYDRAGDMSAPTRTMAEGRAEEVFSLVDELSRQLLAARASGPGERLDRLAALSTHSLPALKAYLEGEREFRARRKAPTLAAFRRAVTLDSGFVLAHYRAAVAAFWLDEDSLARDETERALAATGRMPEEERRLLEALRLLLAGDALAAEHRYRAILARDPADVDAWYMLGETLHHHNPLHGRSVAESREAFERVLALQPGHAGATFHLLRIAASERRLAAVDSLAARVDSTSSDLLRARALRAFALGDAAEQRRVQADAERVGLTAPVAREVATFTRDLDGAARIATPLTDPRRAPAERAAGHEILVHLALAAGRWDAADVHVRELEQVDSVMALAAGAFAAAHPRRPRDSGALSAVRERLGRWRPAGGTPAAALRLYYLALLSERLGDADSLDERAAELEALSATDGGAGPWAHDFALGVRARAARARGDRRAALALLERLHATPSFGKGARPRTRGVERLLTATLLRESGQLPEARAWERTLGEAYFQDISLRSPEPVP